jgi:hypothetical protein
MPLLATLVLNLSIGTLASLLDASELRRSPRPAHQTHGFRAVALHEVLVAMPVAAYPLVRLTDWSLSYVVDGERVPSLVLATLIALHAVAALAGFALGAHWLREHRPRAVMALTGSCGFAVLAGAVACRERLGVMGSFVQYHNGFGTRGLVSAGVVGTLVLLAIAWAGAAAHLCWSLARRP